MLWCSDNQLTQLPELPASLTVLHCSGNQLTQLPELPASLTVLHCSGNQLTQLPELPASLTVLYCYGNQLTQYIYFEKDNKYEYYSEGIIVSDIKYVRMGCFFRKISDWENNFWNNPNEFPDDGSVKSVGRYNRFLQIKEYLDKMIKTNF